MRTGLVLHTNAKIRQDFARRLTKQGYRTATVADGAQALCFLRAHPETTLVIVGPCMPTVDVPDSARFIERLRRDGSLAHVQVVVMGAIAPARAASRSACAAV